MAEGRLTLDNPIFSGTLRTKPRSVPTYQARPLSTHTVNDIVTIRHTQLQASQVKPTEVKWANEVKTAPQAALKPAAAVELKDSVQVATPGVKQPASETMQEVTEQTAEQPKLTTRRQKLKKMLTGPQGLYAMAGVLILFGVFVNVHGLLANSQVASQVQTLQKQAQVKGASTVATTTGTPPSTDKPAAAAVRSYTVAPALPKYIDITSLGIHARVLSMTVDGNNELQAPYSIWDAGWYNASSQPGQAGAMLIDGHSGIGVTRGIFHDLGKLKVGEKITITKGDNSVVTYQVVTVATVNTKDVNMSDMLVSADTTKPGLNIITCTGKQIAGTTSLDKRVLVHAVMQ